MKFDGIFCRQFDLKVVNIELVFLILFRNIETKTRNHRLIKSGFLVFFDHLLIKIFSDPGCQMKDGIILVPCL